MGHQFCCLNMMHFCLFLFLVLLQKKKTPLHLLLRKDTVYKLTIMIEINFVFSICFYSSKSG